MAFPQRGHNIISETTCDLLCFFWLIRVGILWYFCFVLVFPVYSWRLVRHQEPWYSVAEEKNTFKIKLFYTRLRRNSVFIFFSLCFCVLPKAVGCRVGKVYSWVLFEGGQTQVKEWYSGYPLTRRKRKHGSSRLGSFMDGSRGWLW